MQRRSYESYEFPEGIRAYAQYGDSVSVLVGLLSTYGAVSSERIHVLLGESLGVSLSTGTVSAMVAKCAQKVSDTLETIKSMLIRAKVANFDETGTNVNGKTFWVHNSASSELTYQTIDAKRGRIWMETNGVLPEFEGVASHDCFSTYWQFDGIEHAVCNAHLLRELTGIEENNSDHVWATKFKALLCSMKKAKDKAVAKDKKKLSYYYLNKFDRAYDELMILADQECPLPPDPPIKKEDGEKNKERSLSERLTALKGDICLFVRNFDVPFDNNQAE